MPITRQQAANARAVGVTLTLNDTARKLTRVAGSLYSIANFIRDTIPARRGFRRHFEASGSKSSANARALWRFHDRRWKTPGQNDDDDDEHNDDEEEEETIDDEVDRRIGDPFTF